MKCTTMHEAHTPTSQPYALLYTVSAWPPCSKKRCTSTTDPEQTCKPIRSEKPYLSIRLGFLAAWQIKQLRDHRWPPRQHGFMRGDFLSVQMGKLISIADPTCSGGRRRQHRVARTCPVNRHCPPVPPAQNRQHQNAWPAVHDHHHAANERMLDLIGLFVCIGEGVGTVSETPTGAADNTLSRTGPRATTKNPREKTKVPYRIHYTASCVVPPSAGGILAAKSAPLKNAWVHHRWIRNSHLAVLSRLTQWDELSSPGATPTGLDPQNRSSLREAAWSSRVEVRIRFRIRASPPGEAKWSSRLLALP